MRIASWSSPASARARSEILSGCHFEVGRLTVDQMDLEAGPLHEHGLVGSDNVGSRRHGLGEDVPSEGLRRLGQEDRLARQRRADDARRRRDGLLDRVDGRNRGDRGAVRRRGLNGPVDRAP